MKSSVITFPGSNCDRDMDVALKKFGFNNKMVWHDDIELPKTDLVVFSSITQPESKCHICNEEYTMYDICRKIENCGHYYHSDCIDNWFINNKNCPICNQNV